MTLSAEFVAGLREILGERGVISDASDQAPYLSDARQWAESSCDIVARPSTIAEVAEIVRRCQEAKIPIVPRGGGTGLVGGTVVTDGMVLSLDRMRAVQHVDPLNMTMTVEAGCILKDIQDAAAEAECYFPLSLGAEGSCQIGGNISTNAGGVGVLRYGNTRELVMGLEVVLPNGEIWDGMNALRKNNMGYDLKQLFIGAEGTLGIITRAVLKLFPRPRTRVTLLAAMDGLERILPLFDLVRANLGDRVTAFELIPRLAMELCTRHIDGLVDPFTEPHPQYALIEVASPRTDENLRGEIERVLGGALETDQISDAVFTESEGQALALWRLRESIPEAQTREGASIKHDVSVPVSRTTEFIEKANALLTPVVPGVRFCAFGHIGDGNIHYNLTQPVDADGAAFMDRAEELHRIVHDMVVEMGGSISAEHGIGTFKKAELARYRSSLELDLMRRIKRAMDPGNIMNPGKIISV